jgi:hypothetical protein
LGSKGGGILPEFFASQSIGGFSSLMSKFPIFPVHILYDNSVIDEEQLVDSLRVTLEKLSTDLMVAEAVRMNLIKIGNCMDTPVEPQLFVSKLEHFTDYLDLKSAFELVSSDFQALDRTKQGFGNPEVLLLIGSESLPDWLPGWRQLEKFRTLILTYWVSNHQLGHAEKIEKENWLAIISPSDSPQAPRYKIVELPDSNQTAFLNDVFRRLEFRLQQRIHQSGPIRKDVNTL